MSTLAARRRPAADVARRAGLTLAWVLAAAWVLVQMAFPEFEGGTIAMTVASVLLMCAAMLTHAAATRGVTAALVVLAVAGGGGLVAEAVGVATGFPFGDYHYTGTLGAELLGVPVVVPLAWAMMAYPALLVGRLLTVGRSRVLTVAVAAWGLASWDVFLDPQMVDAGHWRWEHPTPALPGVAGIPLTNFAGWLVVALLLCAVLDRLVPEPRDRLAAREGGADARATSGDADLLPVVAYLWTYFSSVLAHAAFFGRPSVAVAGGLAMGLVGVPLAVWAWRHRRRWLGRARARARR